MARSERHEIRLSRRAVLGGTAAAGLGTFAAALGGSLLFNGPRLPEARPAGTRWYHTHVQEHRQLDLGLAAPLIIEPAQAEPFPFDREYTLVLDDWATGTGRALPPTREGVAGGRGSMGGMMGMMRGGMMGGMGGMMGGGGMGGMMG